MKINKTNTLFFHIRRLSLFILCLIFAAGMFTVSVSAKSDDDKKVVRVGGSIHLSI